MKVIKNLKIKFFLIFFIFSSFFAYWTSWNEETNFLLIKEIVNNKSLYFDNYRKITGDVICTNEHCFPPFSRWGFSLFLVFPYSLFEYFIGNENIIKFLLTIFSSCLFFSLSSLLIYQLSEKLLRKRTNALFVTIFYGFSTIMFQQARLFTTHSLESFFALLILYLFFRLQSKNPIKVLVINGIVAGYGLLLTPIFRIIFLMFLILFLLQRRKREFMLFLLEGFLVYMSFYISFLSIVKPTLSIFPITTPIISTTIPKGFESKVFVLSSFLQLLFFPSKGLLFYYPALFFPSIGYFFMIKKCKKELFSFFFLIPLSVFFISLFSPLWWFGWVSYGASRALTILMPFFTIGLIGFIKRFGFKLLVPFVLISIFNNFLLLQYGEDKISTLSWEEYKYKMEHFQVLSNPLFDHYLPLTLINGPRSVLLENLIINKKVSIDFKHPYNPETPEFIPPGSPIMKKFEVYLFSIPKIGIVVLRLPWLSLFVIGVLLILIWKNEIFRKVRINNRILVLILILIFFSSFIRVRNIAYGDNWCAPQWDENNKRVEEGRWIGQNTTLYFFSRENTEKILRLSVESFKENQTLEIYLNGKFIANYTIQKRKEISQPIKLKEGVNELMLRTKGDFIHPWLIGVNCDIDLVSFKISKISFQ